MSYGTGTDARFPYEVRQNVVIGLVVYLLWEQELRSEENKEAIRGSVWGSVSPVKVRHRLSE